MLLLINTVGWLLIVASVFVLAGVVAAVVFEDIDELTPDEFLHREDFDSGVVSAVLFIVLFLVIGVTLTRF